MSNIIRGFPWVYKAVDTIWVDELHPLQQRALTFYHGQLLYVTGEKRRVRNEHFPDRWLRDDETLVPHDFWFLQPIQAPYRDQYSFSFPEGFEALPESELRDLIERDKKESIILPDFTERVYALIGEEPKKSWLNFLKR